MKRMIVCNQKMFLTLDEAISLKKQMDELNLLNIDLVVCPSYLNMNIFSGYNLGAQDAFYKDKGPFTGEISSYDLSLRGVKYVIVGHSERRIYDSNEIINEKVKSILKNNMIPIICVGETKLEKDLMKTAEVLKKQITTALKDVTLDEYQKIIIAYEPSYVIGSKKPIKKAEIEDALKYIKKIIKSLGVTNYKVLYGGAVTKDTVKEVNTKEADGYLLGSSCVDITELKSIIECIK